MTAQTQIYRERLHLLTQPGGQVWLYMVKTMAQVDARAKWYLSGVMVGVQSNNLRSSQGPPTVVQLGNGSLLGVLENRAAYAFFVHEGTKPHDIQPRDKKWLHFEPSVAVITAGTGGGRAGTGTFVFAKTVHHPGTKPRPFLRRALEDVRLGIA